MPRNVVTLVPRVPVLPWRGNRERRERILTQLGKRYRFKHEDDPARIEIDFPKRFGRESAKAEVMAELDRIDPRWRRLFAVYPRE